MSKPISQLTEEIEGLFEAVNAALEQTAEATRARLAVQAPPPTYPIEWDSPKQQIAYHASDGFGGGIPYRRKGVVHNSWRVGVTPYSVSLAAPHPAGAVYGMPSGWQSSIHRNRWVFLMQVVWEELGKLPRRISNNISVEEI